MFTTFEAWLKWQEFGLGTVEVLGSIPCHKINIYEKKKKKKQCYYHQSVYDKDQKFSTSGPFHIPFLHWPATFAYQLSHQHWT